MLKNLGATFAGAEGSSLSGLVTTPVVIRPGVMNAYTSVGRSPAWFPAGTRDLSGLPTGDQRLADVTYHINDFKTSPVPGAIMLAGHGSQTKATTVTGIAINRTAVALCFLHTWNPTEKAEKSAEHPVVMQYTVHYADGSTTVIPVAWNHGIGTWYTSTPVSLTEASLAWSAAFPSDAAQQAVVYSLVWRNPKPTLGIASIDLGYAPGGEAWGAPALLAISTVAGEK